MPGRNTSEASTQELRNEWRELSAGKIFDPEYRRQKLIRWSVRTGALIVIYLFIWDYPWARWSLLVTAPWTIMSLLMVLVMPRILQKKLDKAKDKIDYLETKSRELETPDEPTP